jgi:hypothetical protein
MEKNKTAVDWLLDNIYLLNSLKWNEVIETAKQMEKDQMIEFAMHLHKVDDSKTGTDILMDEAEQYYNETYANDTTTGLPEEDSKRRAWHY